MPGYVELTDMLEIGLLKLQHDGSEEKGQTYELQ
jgi:hypothetical protein